MVVARPIQLDAQPSFGAVEVKYIRPDALLSSRPQPTPAPPLQGRGKAARSRLLTPAGVLAGGRSILYVHGADWPALIADEIIYAFKITMAGHTVSLKN